MYSWTRTNVSKIEIFINLSMLHHHDPREALRQKEPFSGLVTKSSTKTARNKHSLLKVKVWNDDITV